MEQPCHKCGQSIEEGVAFCPHCAAPQIRVVVAEPAPGSPQLATGAPLPNSADLAAAQPVPISYVSMPWSHTLKPCALAALVASLLMALGLYPLVALPSAGFLAVVFYRHRQPGITLRAGIGARLGAISGFFFFGMSTALATLRVIFLHEGGEFRRKFLEQVQQAAARYPDPQYQAGLDFFRSPTGLVFMVVFLLIFLFLACLILGTLGGALGGTILGRRDKP